MGKVRDDQLGSVFAHDVQSVGVQYDVPPATDGPATARCLIFVTRDAQRTMSTYLGASSLIGPDDVDEDLVAQAKVTFCEGYLWDLPAAKAALVKGMDVAARTDGKVAFSLSDSFCVERHREEFLDLVVNKIDILFANEAEICSLYQVDSWDEAAALVSGHCEIACLTRSEHGSVIVTRDGERVSRYPPRCCAGWWTPPVRAICTRPASCTVTPTAGRCLCAGAWPRWPRARSSATSGPGPRSSCQPWSPAASDWPSGRQASRAAPSRA